MNRPLGLILAISIMLAGYGWLKKMSSMAKISIPGSGN